MQPASGSLRKALRRDAVARANAEADQYRRRLLGDLSRSHRNLRHLFIATFVAACGVLALTESSPSAQASRADPRMQTRAPAPVAAPAPTHTPPVEAVHTPRPAARVEQTTTTPAAVHAPAAPAPKQVAPQPARVVPALRPTVAGARPGTQPAWKARGAAAPARWQPKPAALKRPAIAPKHAPAQPVRAPLKPAAH
ncbi:MAG: hypothetical protein ABW252_21170 [Polyangiales bacterium]